MVSTGRQSLAKPFPTVRCVQYRDRSSRVASARRRAIPTEWEVSGIPCVRRVEIQIPMLNRSG
ncbi:hypothetical protein C6T60_07755 [Burkholderia multivorans]|nr:hypothetical protein C6T60_07755 [Burkholderia multivorans]